MALLAAASSVGGITGSEDSEDFEAWMSDVILWTVIDGIFVVCST